MTTCSDCGVPLLDEPPRDDTNHELVTYDMTAWDERWQKMLAYQLHSRKIQWRTEGANMLVRADDKRKVDELIYDLEATHPSLPETADAFILPDGRRVKELPLGPDVPVNRPENPIDWIERHSWNFRWLMTAFRDIIRRLSGKVSPFRQELAVSCLKRHTPLWSAPKWGRGRVWGVGRLLTTSRAWPRGVRGRSAWGGSRPCRRRGSAPGRAPSPMRSGR
jgi:hypothetical protein